MEGKPPTSYRFPRDKLAKTINDPTKTPLVIVACGSYSPVTYLHLRNFEIAMDYIRDSTDFEVIGGYLSPVSDGYKKKGLESAEHRARMCALAVESSPWIMVDEWECSHSEFQRTALVLDHFYAELNAGGGMQYPDGGLHHIRIMLLAGADLIESFSVPNLWLETDVQHILRDYGCVIIEREGVDIHKFILLHTLLYRHKRNVHVIKQHIVNDVSSTKIRLFIKRGLSIRYLTPDSVIRHIEEHALYVADTNA